MKRNIILLLLVAIGVIYTIVTTGGVLIGRARVGFCA
jgi:hypothetical protein